MKIRGYVALAVAAAGAVPRICLAQIAFTDFGPGHTYGNGVAWAVFGSASPHSNNEDYAISEQFTSSLSGSLTQILLSGYYQNLPAGATMTLRHDSGDVVGAVMGTWAVALPPNPGPFQTVSPVAIPNSDTSISLVASDKYWLEMSAPLGSTSQFGWYQNGVGLNDLYSYSIDGGPWTNLPSQTAATFEVDLTPAPEPWSAVVLCVSAMALVRRKRRQTC
ncbi:MAG: hypothetical protein ACYC96_07025 [Fimbriimonadaceae bacterium]